MTRELGPIATSALLPALALVQAAEPAAAEEYYTVDEALRLAFPAADGFEKTRVLAKGDQRARLEELCRARRVSGIFSYYVAVQGGRPIGYGVVDNALGKSEPITYLAAVGPDLAVRSIEILAYRESHGFEVRQKRFRGQFPGKTLVDPLRVRRDITNISGATISCESVTNGVHDVLAKLTVLAGPIAVEEEVIEALPTPPAPPAAGAALSPYTRSRLLMGTTLEVTVYADGKAAAAATTARLFDEVARLEALLSFHRADSELGRLNAAPAGEWVPLSPETLACLRRARAVARRTGGAFDPTGAPLNALWKGAPARGAAPGAEALAAARAAVGWEQLELEDGRARLLREGAAVDLGGVGKGYALDRAAELLARAGIRSALLDFGGNVLALEPPPGATTWSVPLRDPRAPDRVLGVLSLARRAVSTTADYERGLVLGNRRYSHVVDPRSGRPVEGALGATVIAASATEADALSTALFVLGAEEARRYAERERLSVLFVPASGEPSLSPACVELYTPAAGR